MDMLSEEDVSGTEALTPEKHLRDYIEYSRSMNSADKEGEVKGPSGQSCSVG